MVQYTTIILKFDKQGEKTGWTYIDIPPDVAQQIKPGNKKSFRVKGKLDNYSFTKTAILPMGEGAFILPLNALFRKGIGKRHGVLLKVQMEEDKTPLQLNEEFMMCLSDEPEGLTFFNQLAKSHQHYFSKWIESAKTEATKVKRIAQAVNALTKQQGYPEMLRAQKSLK